MTGGDLFILAPAVLLILCLGIAVVCAFSMRKASRIVAWSTWMAAMLFIQACLALCALANDRRGVQSIFAIAIVAEILIIVFSAKGIADFRKRHPAGFIRVEQPLITIWLATLVGLAFAGSAAISYVETRSGIQLAVACVGALALVCCAVLSIRSCNRKRVPVE